MKKFYLACALSGFALTASAQVGINNPTPDNSAVLDLTSTSKGLLIPRMNATERGNIASPAVGLMVYQTDLQQGFWYFTSPGGWTFLNPTGSADNLGNHTATQNLGLNGHWLSNDGDAEGIRIGNNGFVGVSNDSPLYRLHLESDNLGSGGTDDVVMTSYSGTPGIALQHARGTKAAPANMQAGDQMGIFAFGGYRNGGMSFSLSGMASYYQGDGITNLTDLILFNNSAERMRLHHSGNIGIGSVNPLTKLSITPGTAEAKITLWDGGSATDHYGFGVSAFQLNYHVEAITNRHVFYAGGKNGNGTELMRVQGNGFIGISDANPQSKLSISSNATEPKITLWDGNSTVNHYGFGISSSQLNYHVDYAGASHVFYQSGKNGDGKELMRIKGTGQVGIGTPNPGTALTVRDTLSGLGFSGWFEGNHANWAGVYTNAMKATANPSWGYARQGATVGSHFIDTNNKWNLWLTDGTSALYTRMTVEGPTGRVGIGTTLPQQMLHVAGNARITGVAGGGTRMLITDNNGDLSAQAVPVNTDNQTLGIAGNQLSISGGNTVTLPSSWTLTSATYNANGTLSVNTSIPSTITSGNAAWLVGGNTLGGTGILGTLSNNHVDLYSSNQVRGRLSSLGEFFIGTTSTTQAGDLMAAVGNATFPWAINGSTNFNGGGVYGAIQGANNTQFAGVHGENTSSTGNFNSAGVRGVNSSVVAGTGFRILAASGPRMGVTGNVSGTGAYSFGVHGSTPSASLRTGGLFGDDGGWAMGSVGYFASNGVDYSFYAFGNVNDFATGGSGGRMSGGRAVKANAHIGLGVHGGVMGGWVRGSVYGAHFSGARYGAYVDGKTITNDVIAQLQETPSGRVATYAAGSMQADVTARGRGQLSNGTATITFSEGYRALLSEKEPPIITITPVGACNGLYLESAGPDGFTVKELGSGRSSVGFTWIAIGSRKGYEEAEISAEILNKDFDQTMRGVMHNELDEKPGTPIWWDGTQVRHDMPPAHPTSDQADLSRPKGDTKR